MYAQSHVSADSTADQTYSISPAWDIDKNDVQQLVHLSEEKNSLFRYGLYVSSSIHYDFITGFADASCYMFATGYLKILS